MFALALYFALSTASLFALFQLLATKNENCSCGKCDEHDEKWHELRATLANLNPLQSLIVWPVMLIFALPIVVFIVLSLIWDLVRGGTDSSQG